MSTLSTANIESRAANTPPVIKDLNGTECGKFCRAWVNFNGAGTLAVRDSFNVDSVTDVATGKYTVNFTNGFGNTNYCPVMYNNANSLVGLTNFSNQYTGGMKLNNSSLEVASYNAGYSDSANFFIVVFGD